VETKPTEENGVGGGTRGVFSLAVEKMKHADSQEEKKPKRKKTWD